MDTAVSRNKKPLSCYAVSHASMGGTKGAGLYLGKDGSVWYAGGFRLRAFVAGERVGPLPGPKGFAEARDEEASASIMLT